MMHRLFTIVCLLGTGMGTRTEDDEEVLATRDAVGGQLARTSGAECKESELPTPQQNQYCHYFNEAEKTCKSDVKCRWVDLSKEQNGKEMCKPVCKTSTNSEVNGLEVPKEVNSAVQQARAVAEASKSKAAAKVQQTDAAAEDARTKKKQAEKAVEDAAAALELAESNERAAMDAQATMQGAFEKEAIKDTAASAAVDAWKQATVVKQQKLEVMNAALKAKQLKEAEWKHQDELLRVELENQLKPEILELERQLARAKARRQEVQNQRTAHRTTKQTEVRQAVDAYKEVVEEYKVQKSETESLEADAKQKAEASSQASAQAKTAVEDYWEKVNLMNEASAARASRKKGSDQAQDAALEAQTYYAQQAEAQAAALQEEADALALVMKVEEVYEFAAAFYEQLAKVTNPGGPNPLMNIAKLALDPAMQPTLASYNVVVTSANELAETTAGAAILVPLKEGIEKIDEARYNHFKQWCGDKEFHQMIWGANDMTQVELKIY